ncbi:MAG: VCBS repeat-containing protein, partial [Cyclobacteriaceae bacterium]|nr:VCBS repeat-containing protein [Cyclobacteriaceae bacterium]
SKDNKWSTAVTFVDIDNDGDQDIYVCRFVYLENEESANQLYINNGDLTFTEQAGSYGLADKGFSTQAVFCDFDKDGWVDMYLVNQPPSIPGRRGKISNTELSDILFSDRMYKNMGNGNFVDFTDRANIRNFAFGLSAIVGDFNNDTWLDIYVTNDFDVADHVYINQQDGTFTDVLHQSIKHISHFSMGSDVADYDNDGNLDIMVIDMIPEYNKRIKTHMASIIPEDFWNIVNTGGHYQYMFNTLQRNNGNGTFSELAQLAGVTSTDWSWGPLIADFDNDGYKDIFITNGILRNNLHSDLASVYEQKLDSLRRVAQRKKLDPKKLIDVFDFVDLAATDKLPNYIYKNNGDYTFSKKIKEWGMELPTLSNGAAYADFDLDGDLDLVINNLDENALLYKNNARENGAGNYIRFKMSLLQDQNIYGTKVTLYQNDKLWQMYQITNVRGFRSKSEDIVHFGVGKEMEVDKVVFEWQNGAKTILTDLATNQLYEVNQEDAKQSKAIEPSNVHNVMFKDVANYLNLSRVTHRENNYDDYSREILLPHKMSQFGPSLGIGDVNGDNREDFYIGGPAGISGTLFLQNRQGKFDEIKEGAWSQDRASEDMGVAFIDVDGDSDLDMMVVSGGNEFNADDAELQDRLYINNGRGEFKKKIDGLPEYLTSGSCVVPNDFDKDGDIDLFIGGRLIPRKYPHPANSHLLENRGGRYVEVTEEKAPELSNLGLVTAATWTDHNNDGLDDLVIVGEWMPITIFTQFADGHFEKQLLNGLADSEGWYYEVQAEDIDGDGDEDFVVGNLGLNYKYKASPKKPFEVFSYDFDRNGSFDIVLSYYEDGVLYP